jgi:SAM-dependent methyltransferase
METGALAPYEQALRATGRLGLRAADGRFVELDVARWLAGVDGADVTVLDRCTGPVLDIGCGPGRFVSALNARGVAALGVDIAETAVALTRGQGMPALLRNVFADLPGEGRWPTVLLMDGNIGIGGDPARLLQRIRGLLAPGGRLLVETHSDDAAHDVLDVCFSVDGAAVGPSFGWAHVGRTALLRYAAAAGYSAGAGWSSAGRPFLALAP